MNTIVNPISNLHRRVYGLKSVHTIPAWHIRGFQSYAREFIAWSDNLLMVARKFPSLFYTQFNFWHPILTNSYILKYIPEYMISFAVNQIWGLLVHISNTIRTLSAYSYFTTNYEDNKRIWAWQFLKTTTNIMFAFNKHRDTFGGIIIWQFDTYWLV